MNLGANFRINKMGLIIVLIVLFLIYYIGFDTWTIDSEKSKGELVNLKHILIAAIRAAEFGGVTVVLGKNKDLNIKSKGKTLEGANDPVTDVDYASNCVMLNSLVKTFPNINIISEEPSSEDAECQNQTPLDLTTPERHRTIDLLYNEYVHAKDVTMWIDPLDATQEYTEDLNDYVTTMTCVAVKGVPIIGVIHKPFLSRTSWAWYTKTRSSDLPDWTNKLDNKLSPRVIVSRSHKGQVETFVNDAFAGKAFVSVAGGAGYKVLEVANGRADVYLHTTAIKKWDICAGNAIINAMGGKMTTLSGKTIDYSSKSDVKNSEGLLVSLFDHQYYLNKTLPLLPQ